ncbi:MAG: DNA recombination protein RmuC [Patescibacteria group bacterium]|nr:DNA recombination protein RmuC [Patescibacteria group bacterium]
MEILLILLIILVAVVIIIQLAAISRGKRGIKPTDDSSGLKLLLDQVNRLSDTVDRKLGENTKEMSNALHRQFGESQRLIKDITSEITQVKKIGEQSLSVQNQLRELEDILKNPKHRGILGEYYLETLLKNVLPPGQYQMQYPFKNGEVVDAAVFVKDKVIPVDSKFSLENYNKMAEEKNPADKERLEKAFVNDLKLRIQETAKYIRPDEKTMDFAFMFIPHEAIYYDLLVNKIGSSADETDNLIQRAASKYKVIIVSPTSFLAYLQTVLQGLKAMQIEETAKDIVKHVGQLGTHLKKYEDYHSKLGVSLSTVVNHYNNSSKEFKKVDKDVLRITGETPGLEPVLLDKPEVTE